MTLLRRTLLRSVLPAAVARTGAAETISLAHVAARRGLVFGAAPFGYPPQREAEYDKLVAAQCAAIAPVLNWRLISPSRGEYRTGTDLGSVAFAGEHAQALTGYHLLWHEALPNWITLMSPDDTRREIETYIARMGATYAAATWSVNVVNEALDPSGRSSNGLRPSPILSALGPSFLEIAFRAARDAFPRALLLLNDYGMEQGGEAAQIKRRALIRQLDRLRAAGAPIDGVGLQAHLRVDRSFDAQSYAAFLAGIADRGLCIVATELDVLDIGAPAEVGTRDAVVANLYARYLRALLTCSAVRGLVTWGLSDRYTWLTPATGSQFARPDGLPTRPLPFDADFRPKPAYFAIVEALRTPGGRW